MHMKIVIVVTRTFWRCAACKVLRKKSDSIDNHLRSCHPQFTGTAACRTNVSDSARKTFEKDTLSDSEIVDKLRGTCDINAESSCGGKVEDQNNLSCTSFPQAPMSGWHHGTTGIQDDERSTKQAGSKQNRTDILSDKKQQSKCKTSKILVKLQTAEMSDSDGAVDSLTHLQDMAPPPIEKSKHKSVPSKKRTLRISKPRSSKTICTTKSLRSITGSRVQKGNLIVSGICEEKKEGEKPGDTMSEKVTDEFAGPVGEAKNTGAKRGRRRKTCKTKQSVDSLLEPVTSSFQHNQFNPLSTTESATELHGRFCGTKRVKPTVPTEHTRANFIKVRESLTTADESNTNKEHVSASTKGSGKDKLQSESTKKQCPELFKLRAWKPVDKTRIATSCAPWLFGTGRKAGDKVNKKPRRLLLPEEKQAVRDLYGIPAYQQLCKSQAGLSKSSDSELDAVEVAKPDLAPTAAAVLHTFTVQNDSSMEDCSIQHRNFPSGAPDFARASGNLFSGYDGMLQQQSDHYVVQSTNLYQMAIGNAQLPQRNFTHYPDFGPVNSGLNQGKRNNQQHTDMSLISLPPTTDRAEGSIGLTPKHTSAQHTNLSATPSASQKGMFDGTSRGRQSEHNKDKTDVHITCIAQKVSNSQESLGEDGQERKCEVCLETFSSADLKQQHQQENSFFGIVECKRCKQKFHGLHQLNVHVFSDHETEKQGFCFYCNQDKEGLEILEKHVHIHALGKECALSNLKYHNCRICKEEIQSVYATIRTHYYQHHIAHVCGECFQNFKDIATYIEHCQIHIDKIVFCSICGAEFPSAEILRSHFPCAQDAWAEDGVGSHCYKCGLWCPNKAVREAHRKQHRSQDDVEAYRKGAQKGFPCVSCEKVFKNKHACRRHMKMVHQGVSCYKHYCEYCGKGFLTKGHMRDHTAMHHLGIKRYSCQYCDQHFVCGPTLRRHVRKEHTKHKPYECEHCGERFFEKTPLQRHLTKHTGLAPFMCEHCGKGFYTKHSFTNHGTTHSTVRDFICKGCQKGFTRKYNLQAHMKICKLV